MELLYHVPLSAWAIGALVRDDVKIPIHLLIYATQTAMTTLTCIADYLSWTTVSSAEKLELGKLYVPYLALCEFLFLFFSFPYILFFLFPFFALFCSLDGNELEWILCRFHGLLKCMCRADFFLFFYL